MHYLSVLAIFKNEGHIINEWLNHYLLEGVDHFYLIDLNMYYIFFHTKPFSKHNRIF